MTVPLVKTPSRPAHTLKSYIVIQIFMKCKGYCVYFSETKANTKSRSIQLLVTNPKCDVMT